MKDVHAICMTLFRYISFANTCNFVLHKEKKKNKLLVTFLVCHCINQLIEMQEYIPLHYVQGKSLPKSGW